MTVLEKWPDEKGRLESGPKGDVMEHKIKSLRAKLTEASAQRNSSNRKIKELTDQLLATQAHAARVENALKHLWHNVQATGKRLDLGVAPEVVKAALSTPINLDALHEDRARECERIKNGFPQRSPLDTEAWLDREVSAHRAKKESA